MIRRKTKHPTFKSWFCRHRWIEGTMHFQFDRRSYYCTKCPATREER